MKLTSKRVKALAQTQTALLPSQVAAAYNFPQGVDVSKRTVAILELGGAYNPTDVFNYCKSNGYKLPSLTSMFVDGATAVSDPQGADGEICLDLDVIAAIAQGCNIVVVFAPNSSQGFIDGVAKCISLNPDAVSISWGCYDKETEVLTNQGWKYFADVRGHELIATLNPDTKELEYQPIKQVHKYPFKGQMHSYQGRCTDLVVTPNHNMYVKDARHDAALLPSEQIFNKNWYSVPKTAQWNGAELETIEIAGQAVSMDLWLEFLGYFLSEGWTSVGMTHHKESTVTRKAMRLKQREREANGRFVNSPSTAEREEVVHIYNNKAFDERTYATGVAQVKTQNLGIIQKCLDALPFKFRRKETSWLCSNKELCNSLVGFGKSTQKFVPAWVKNLSTRQLRIFYDALMLGDGTRNGKGKQAYYTSSRKLADDVQEILLKLGFVGSVRTIDRRGRVNAKGTTRHVEYRVNIKERLKTERLTKRTLIDYDDFVYCLTVPNHIMFVRRNGMPAWCGNSPENEWDADSRTQLDALFLQAAQRGIPVFVAAGDNSSSDGETFGHTDDYPSSSPYAISCGGTTLQLNADGTRLSETAWSKAAFSSEGGGGGISKVYPETPNWQAGTMPTFPAGRRSPDISGNANPDTGYSVNIDGQLVQIGGTSAVAPLYAAYQAIINAMANRHIGNSHSKIYESPECFFDVTTGSNGYYKAGKGYDCVTGMGVLDGTAFAKKCS